jgi:SAM-dependent methyltransferase
MSEKLPPNSMDWDQRFRDDSTPWERPGLHPAFQFWQAADVFNAGQKVLVPGCGRAPELVEFARLGLQVSGADLSATALDWQDRQLAGAGLIAERVEGDTLAYTPKTPFDLVYEQTFLCAISPKLRGEYEAAAHRWLKPGGALLALFMQKDEPGGPPYGCSLDAMHALFPAERWDWPGDDEFNPFPHPSLDNKPELAGILVRR